MKKCVSAMVAIICALAVVILVNVFFNKPPETLNEEYINSWILMGDESVDEILFMSNEQNYTACICSVSDNELMFLVLENNKTFDMHFRHSFTLNTLTHDATQTMTDEMLSDEDIMYNIFLNPDVKTVTINDIEYTVNTFRYNEHTIGFWWSEV